MDVLITHGDGTRTVEYISFRKVNCGYSRYIVSLGDTTIGEVHQLQPYNGWQAMAYNPPGHEELSHASADAGIRYHEATERGNPIDIGYFQQQYETATEQVRENFARYLGRNLISRRHAVYHLLRASGYVSWQTEF